MKNNYLKKNQIIKSLFQEPPISKDCLKVSHFLIINNKNSEKNNFSLFETEVSENVYSVQESNQHKNINTKFFSYLPTKKRWLEFYDW